jgi:hypothetical protein
LATTAAKAPLELTGDDGVRFTKVLRCSWTNVGIGRAPTRKRAERIAMILVSIVTEEWSRMTIRQDPWVSSRSRPVPPA